ncbi:hypothetical protein B0H19DRAFT_1081036 [Mycena capillaripes]|nr:hypothetical protein B0H19DRAFT_1081036 [Mycena capillaripes]
MLNKVLFAILAMVMAQGVVGVPTLVPKLELPCGAGTTHSGEGEISMHLWRRHRRFSSLGTRPQLVEANEKPKNNGMRDALTARQYLEKRSTFVIASSEKVTLVGSSTLEPFGLFPSDLKFGVLHSQDLV